jgi:hypothetical protein
MRPRLTNPTLRENCHGRGERPTAHLFKLAQIGTPTEHTKERQYLMLVNPPRDIERMAWLTASLKKRASDSKNSAVVNALPELPRQLDNVLL